MELTAIGMIETKGLTPLVYATDAMLKAARVQFKGWRKVGSGLCTSFVARTVGELVSVHVIPRPHDDLAVILPK